jgi:hypothetical protein
VERITADRAFAKTTAIGQSLRCGEVRGPRRCCRGVCAVRPGVVDTDEVGPNRVRNRGSGRVGRRCVRVLGFDGVRGVRRGPVPGGMPRAWSRFGLRSESLVVASTGRGLRVSRRRSGADVLAHSCRGAAHRISLLHGGSVATSARSYAPSTAGRNRRITADRCSPWPTALSSQPAKHASVVGRSIRRPGYKFMCGYMADVRPDIANELVRLGEERRREADWGAVAVAAVNAARVTRHGRRVHGPRVACKRHRRAA